MNGKKNLDDFSAANIIEKVFADFFPAEMKESLSIHNVWNEVVSTVRSGSTDYTQKSDIGSQLADHSRVVDLKNGVLIVETDHPGRIQLFQMYSAYILRGLKMKVKELDIHSISYILKK